MVSIRKKKQQNKMLFRQLSEGDFDFVIEQSNHDVQNENVDSMAYRGTSTDNANILTQISYPRVDMNTIEENIVTKVQKEVDNVMKTAKLESKTRF